jgi:hypothetical protein
MMLLPASSALSGVALSGAALLAVAGVGKLHSGVRGPDSDSAIRRALGIGPGVWRLIELTAGALECATAAVVLTGLAPTVAGAVMAGQGAVFTGLLAHARRVGAPGGCGCLGRRGEEAVTWRSFARALWVLAAGLLQVAAPWPGPGSLSRPWPVAGAVVGVIVVVLLEAGLPDRTPRCHRRLWFPLRDTARALVRHPAFAAMGAGMGPPGRAFRYRRTRCVEEFWFPAPAAAGETPRVVGFRVTRGATGALAVHASLLDEMPALARRRSHPLRARWLR